MDVVLFHQRSFALTGLIAVFLDYEQEVFAAMIALKEGRDSFADALIAALGARVGCTHTITFDKKALRLPGFAHP
jgi:predicted nucleic-acid-binding protein